MRKILRKYTQGDLFGKNEVKCVRTKAQPYDEYTRGAVDMLLAVTSATPAYTLRHANHKYMKRLVAHLLKDKYDLRCLVVDGIKPKI